MNNSTKVVIPRQALAVIAVVLAWWLYAAIILSLIGVVLWVAWLASGVLFPVWVIVPWATIEILITILMNWECIRGVEFKSQERCSVGEVVCVVCFASTAMACILSVVPSIGGGFYSLWTLVFTVAILAIHFHYQTNGSLKESK